MNEKQKNFEHKWIPWRRYLLFLTRQLKKVPF